MFALLSLTAIMSTTHAFQLPPLIKLDDKSSIKQNHSFTSDANWVIPGILMQGRQPSLGDRSLADNMRLLREDAHISTFVCLQAEAAPQNTDNTNVVILGGAVSSKTDYSYAKEAAQFGESAPKFVHFGIQDFSTVESLDDLCLLCNYLERRIRQGDVLYVHCFGGKGRAGLVCACLLGTFYSELSANEALQRIRAYASTRSGGKVSVSSPETLRQENQVREYFRLLGRK
jgi:hypothetical protein